LPWSERPARLRQLVKDGQIHACYRVKGKAKGNLRVVPIAKCCKRGERKVAWSIAGSGGQAGQPGATGQAGTTGQGGSSGTNGSSGTSEAALKTEVASLSLKLEALEGVLNGVTHGDLVGSLNTLNGLDNAKLLGAVDAVQGLSNGDLSGAVDAVEGLTNGQLLDAVGAVPLVADVCDQASALTSQSNLLRTGLNSLTTTLSSSILGAIFGGVGIPPVLTDPLTCPTP
jgi:hypothetical protein